MSQPGTDTVSVVISTFNRVDACERALRSALAQTAPPLEVLICDNGSTDDTERRMRAWEEREERVRYLRLPVNSGTPASTRNIGIEHARGDFVAFLDDDDEWLETKLATQITAAADADVIASNALRSSGGLYFPAAPNALRPTRLDMLRANPIITSSALVRREPLMTAGGFPTDLRAKGLEDYVMWLDLSLRGLRFLVVGQPLLRYDDSSHDRLSRDRARIQIAVARLAWWHALRRPVRRAGLTAAIKQSVGVLHVLAGESVARLRLRLRAGVPAPGSGGDG